MKLKLLTIALAFATLANSQTFHLQLVAGTNPSCAGAQVHLYNEDQSGNIYSADYWTCSGDCPSGSQFGYNASSLVVTPTVTTTYQTYTLNNSSVYVYSTPYTVTVTPTPSSAGTISGTSTLCKGQMAVAYSVASIANATSYTWSYSGTGFTCASGCTTNSITANFSASATSGNLTVYGNNTCGSGTASANFVITINQPTVTANATATTVCAGTTVTLTGIGTATSYSWSGGVTDGIGFMPSSTTTYTVTGTDGNSCTNTATKTITVNQLPAVTGNATATTICAGTTITLTGSGTATSYSWSGGITNGIGFAPSSTATYTVTGTDGNGCTNTDSKTITVKSTPTVSMSSILNASCNGTNDGSAIANASGGTSPYSYSWNNGQTTSSATNLIAGSYTIIVTGANSCSQTATVSITQPNPLSVNITPVSPSTCKGSSVTLSAGFGYSSYSWSSGQTIASIIILPTTTTTYSATVSDVNGCTGSNSTMVTVNPVPSTPNVTAGGSTTFCQGGFVILYAPIGYSSYVWSPSGQTTTSITVSATGNYFVTVSNAQGCSASSSLTNINVNPLPSATLSITAPICGNNNGNVTITIGGGTPPFTYSWNNGNTTSIVTGLTGSPTQTLIVTIIDSNSCTIKDTAIVQCATGIANYDLQNEFIIYPNPNSGTFTISTKRKDFALTITNILGEKILSQKIQNIKSEIDLSKQPSGIYFLQLKTSEGIATKKIVINK